MIDTKESSVVLERTFHYSIDNVWRALTEPSLIARWMMPNDFRAEVGAVFTLRAEPTPQWDGIVLGKVIEIVPQQRLRYAWTSPRRLKSRSTSRRPMRAFMCGSNSPVLKSPPSA